MRALEVDPASGRRQRRLSADACGSSDRAAAMRHEPDLNADAIAPTDPRFQHARARPGLRLRRARAAPVRRRAAWGGRRLHGLAGLAPARASTWARTPASPSWCRPRRWSRRPRSSTCRCSSRPRSSSALAPDDHPQLLRLRYIAKRIIPFTYDWNPRAKHWKWEVILIGSDADQRLLHAGRQDRLLLRHPGQAAARRRRGGHDHGPRDGARAARTRARAHGQDHGHARRDRDRRGAVRPGRRRARWPPAWAASC